MVFSSLTFLLLFLPGTLLLYFAGRSLRWKNAVLVAASLLFYGWGEPVWILAMLFSTIVNYLCARAICATGNVSKRKLWLFIGAAASLGFLFYFKYAAFFAAQLAALFGRPVPELSVRLPIGISFYTFQVLTYTVDVYRGKAQRQRSFWNLLLYVSCFPQLIAGPIVQYSDVEAQITSRFTTVDDFSDGFHRFVVGLFKKVFFANLCGLILEKTALGGTGAQMSLAGAWYSAFMYTLQIYFDFSAYSDMAIGLGRILGFTYKENFNTPYAAASVTDFWRRWHISLSSFFRDYVYIPLGGNRCGTAKTIRNMLIVWTLTGLWHGASWNFILWGAYYGILLIIERFVLNRVLEKTPAFVRHLLTLLIVMVGWVLFYYTEGAALCEHLWALVGRSGSLAQGLTRLPLVDGKLTAVLQTYTVFPLVAFAAAFPLTNYLPECLRGRGWRDLSTVLLLAASVVFLIGQSYNPFIYFRF